MDMVIFLTVVNKKSLGFLLRRYFVGNLEIEFKASHICNKSLSIKAVIPSFTINVKF